MSMRGSCICNNISFLWKNIDFSLVPRQCGCAYCQEKNAAYVSKSGTRVEVEISHNRLHRVRRHGSQQAAFHECVNCGDVVFVTVLIEGEAFCALNANCLEKRERFPQAIEVNFSNQTAEAKLERWKQNWCHPLLLTGPDGGEVVTGVPA